MAKEIHCLAVPAAVKVVGESCLAPEQGLEVQFALRIGI